VANPQEPTGPINPETELALLREAVASIDVGFSVFDAELRLVTCNARFLELLDFPQNLGTPGTPFEDFIRFNANRGEYGPGDVDELVRERVERSRLMEPHRFDRQRLDGRRIEIVGRPMASGGFVTTYLDRTLDREPLAGKGIDFTTLLRALEHTSEGFHIWDADDRMLYANARMRSLGESQGIPVRIGMTFEEHIRMRVEAGMVLDALDDPESYIAWRLEMHRVGDRSHVSGVSDGRHLLVHDYRLPDGGTVTTTLDITEMKRTETAQQESEARLRDFVTASSDRFWEMDENLRFTMLVDTNEDRQHPPTEQFFGKTRWEQAGVDLDQDPAWREHAATLHAHHPFRDFRYTIPNPDGEVRYWRLSGVPIFNEKGTFRGYRGTSTDETEWRLEREAARRELQIALREAEVANRAKSLFLATVGHELRTPLNAIIGFSDLLVGQVFGDLGDARYLEYARDVRASGHHLLTLIEDVLDLSRVEMGHIQLRESKIDLTTEIQAAITMTRSRHAEAPATIDVDLPRDLPPLWADGRLLRQILINLLSNAVKFTPSDGRIEVTGALDADGVLLRIADDGIGINSRDLDKILRPFEQADNRLSREYEGIGLGLPLAKSFVELHGGRLDIESAPGVGTTVSIRLPMERIRASAPPVSAVDAGG